MSEPKKLCPRCQQIAPLGAASCVNCAHRFRTQFAPPTDQTQPVPPIPATPQTRPPRPQATTPPPQAVQLPSASPALTYSPIPSSPASALPADFLTCRVCGNSGVEKVSAICQSGTWSSRSAQVGVGAAYGRDVGAIRSVSVSASATTGASTLAQMLAPPAMPTYAAANAWLMLFAGSLACVGVLLAVGGIADHDSSAAGVIIFGLVLLCGGVGIIYAAVSGEKHSKREAAAAMGGRDERLGQAILLFPLQSRF